MKIQEALKLAKKKKKKLKSFRCAMEEQTEETILGHLLKSNYPDLYKVDMFVNILMTDDWELDV